LIQKLFGAQVILPVLISFNNRLFMKNIFFLLLTLLLIRCSSKENNEKHIVISQPHTSVADVVNFSDYFEIIEVINLESSDSSIIDYTHKIVFDDFYFILGGGAVYKFDKTGKYILKVKRGEDGPNAIKNLTDLILLKNENRLWIYDSHHRRISQFDYNLIFEINYDLDYPLFGLEKLETGLIGSPGYMMVVKEPYSLFRFSGKNLATGYSLEETTMGFDIEKSDYLHIFRHDYFSELETGDLDFVNSFNDTIYNINQNGESSIKYVIDFKDKRVLEGELVNKGYTSIVDVFNYINSTDKSFNIGNIFESNNSLIYRFFNSGKPYFSIYDKKNNKLTSGQIIKFNYKGQEIAFPIDEEMRIGSFGNGKGYLSIPSESSVIGENQKVFNTQDGDNPIIIIFNEK